MKNGNNEMKGNKGLLDKIKGYKESDWVALFQEIECSVRKIEAEPTKRIMTGKKQTGLIIYDHYRMDRDNDGLIKLSYNFDKEPNILEFIEADLTEQESPIENTINVFKKNDIRHPNKNWVFDNKVNNDEWFYSSFGGGVALDISERINIFSLAFYVKCSAYFGLLDQLDHEVLMILAKLTKSTEITNSYLEADIADHKKPIIKFLIELKRQAVNLNHSNNYFHLKKFTLKFNWDYIAELRKTGKNIKDEVRRMLIHKDVLAYLDTILADCYLTDYIKAVKNLHPYMSGYKSFKKDSSNLIQYIFSYEPDLKGLSNPSHFSFKNKVSSWDQFHNDFTFPQAKSLNNFKKLKNPQIDTKTMFMCYCEVKTNHELLANTEFKNVGEWLSNIKRRKLIWLIFMNWLTHGTEWEKSSTSEIRQAYSLIGCIAERAITGGNTYNKISEHLYKNNESKYLGVEFSKFLDLTHKIIKNLKNEIKRKKLEDTELYKQNKITKNERALRNESYAISLIPNTTNNLIDFIMGTTEINGVERSTLELIGSSTTTKSLIRKSSEWHREQVAISQKHLLEQATTVYKHLNPVSINVDEAVCSVIADEYTLVKEGIEMKNCLGTSYRYMVEDKQYLVFHVIHEGVDYSVGFTINECSYGIEFELSQFVRISNQECNNVIIEILKKLEKMLNKNPYLVLNRDFF